MDNLTVSVSESPFNKDVTLLTVKGSLDTNTISEFDRNFQTALGESRFKLVVDLKEAYYISSAGWGLFVSEIKRIRGENGDLVLAGMNPHVLEVFDLLQFSTILKFFPDVETAVNKGFEGLPPMARKAGPSKNRSKKMGGNAAPLEPIGEPVSPTNLEKAQESVPLPESVVQAVRPPYWRRALRDWRFWVFILLAILAACLATGKLTWHPGTLPHWAGRGK